MPFNCVCTELVASRYPIVAAVTPLVEVGVMAPRDKVIAGVVVAVATVPLIPFAVVTDTEETVPLPPDGVGILRTPDETVAAPVPVVVNDVT